MIKAGGTKEPAKAVRSHTGTLAGSEAVYAAAFRQAGVIRVDDGDDLQYGYNSNIPVATKCCAGVVG